MYRLAALLCLMTSGVTATAAEPDRSPDWISERVAALNSPVFAVREAASRDLLLAGGPALTALRQARDAGAPELRSRAAQLARQIEWHVENERLLGLVPKLRLRFDGTPLIAAVADFKPKTGLEVNLDNRKAGDPGRTITLDTGEVPFWEAVEKFYAAAGLVEAVSFSGSEQFAAPYTTVQGGQVVTSYRIQTRPTNLSYSLVAGGETERGVCVTDGPLRVRVLPLNEAAEPITQLPGTAALTLEVTPMPSLDAQEVIAVRLRRVIDDEGRTLSQAHSADGSNDGSNAGHGINNIQFGGGVIMMENNSMPTSIAGVNPRQIAIGVRTEGHKPATFALVEGHVSVRIQTGPEELLSVADPVAAVGRTFDAAGTELTIIEATEVSGGYRFKLRTRQSFSGSDAMNPFVQVRAARINLNGRTVSRNQVDAGSNLELRDADGKPMTRGNVSMTSQRHHSGPNGIEITQEFQAVYTGGEGRPSRLVMTGMKPFTMRVPFVLKNVPLP